MDFTVYSRNQKDLARLKEIEYNGIYMGSRMVNATLESPVPIEFLPFDWMEYRNERFELIDIPSDKKVAESGGYGKAFTYELSFKPLSRELVNCDFLDIVPNDNNLHYTGFPLVASFMSIETLCARIQANLDRLYKNDRKWTIIIEEGLSEETKIISLSDSSCWDAVCVLQKDFNCNFWMKNRVIHVGQARNVMPHVFKYGKDTGGLYEIERVAADADSVVTRVRAYGGSTNIPRDYKKDAGNLPEAQYIPSLMLPDYEFTGVDYLDSTNIPIYGIREGVFRDESIYPSIQGVTAEMLINAGINVSSEGRIDEIVKVSKITDAEQATFNIWIKDIGFDINEHLSPSPAILSMKDGACGGVEFEITRCIEDSSVAGAKYKLTLNRNSDDVFVLPDAVTNAKEGDHFVLLEIYMPKVYILAAEQKLKEKAEEWLKQNDSAKVTYAIGLDHIFMVKNQALKELMYEGSALPVYDADLGIDRSIILQTLTITEQANDDVATFSLVLSDKPVSTNFNRVQDEVEEITDNFHVNKEVVNRDIRRNVRSLNKLRDKIFDTDGYFDNTNLKPNSIETMYLAVGAKSANFTLLANILPNYTGDVNSIAFTDGQLIHREIKHGAAETDENYTWLLPSRIEQNLDPEKSYYIYAKCSTTSQIADWILTDKMLRYDDNTDQGWYYFKIGVLFEVDEGARADAMDYGKTWINGRFITTGVIQSAYGQHGSYWDLDQDIFKVGKDDSYMDYGLTEENVLTIRDAHIKDILRVSGVAKFAGWLISNYLIRTEQEVNAGTSEYPNMKPRISLNGISNIIELYSEMSGGMESMDRYSGSHIRLDSSNGIVEARAISSGSSKVSYISPSGIFANNAGTNAVSATTGLTRMASVVGLGWGSLAAEKWNNESFICGVYGTASNDKDGDAFGGYFNNLKAAGLILNTRYISDSSSSYDLDLGEYVSLVISLTNRDVMKTVTLPSDGVVGRTIFIKQKGAGAIRVVTKDGQTIHDDSSANDYYDAGDGQELIFHFGKWMTDFNDGNGYVHVNGWLVSRIKY